jgi:hypothetical protein
MCETVGRGFSSAEISFRPKTGESLPYSCWPKYRWHQTFCELGLTVRAWNDDLKLYPRIADWMLGRTRHVIALFELSRQTSALV